MHGRPIDGAYFTTLLGMFGELGLTSTVLRLGEITKSKSSMETVPYTIPLRRGLGRRPSTSVLRT